MLVTHKRPSILGADIPLLSRPSIEGERNTLHGSSATLRSVTDNRPVDLDDSVADEPDGILVVRPTGERHGIVQVHPLGRMRRAAQV